MEAFGSLDPATLLLSIAVFSAALAALSLVLARSVPEHRAELRLWAGSLGCATLAFAGYFLRGFAPAWLTLLLSNLAVLGAAIFGLLTHARYLQHRVPAAAVGAVVAFGWAGPLATQWLNAPMGVAVFSMSLAWSVLGLTTAGLILRSKRSRRNAGTWLSFAAFASLGSVLGVRAVLVLSGVQQVLMKSATVPQLLTLYTGCLFVIFGTLGLVMMVLENQRQRALDSATRDGLTGVLMRAAFVTQAHRHLAQGGAAALLMVDIDHFKQVNDRHGHSGGDCVLVHAARLIASRCRTTDLVGRYGGEEFCVLLPGAGDAAARELAERLVLDARATAVRLKHSECRYTLSVGHAVRHAMPPAGVDVNITLAELFEEADAALFAAKRAGRDRAVAADALRAEAPPGPLPSSATPPGYAA